MVYFTAIGRGDYARRIYITCFLGNLIYTICGILLFAVIIGNILQRGTVGRVLTYIVASCSLVIACTFFFLGFRLFGIFNKLQSGRRSEIIGKVVLISASCTVCFLYKGVYVCLIPTFQQGDVYRLSTYLILGEIVPSLLMAGSFNYFPARWQEAFATWSEIFRGGTRGSRGYGTLNRDQSGESPAPGDPFRSPTPKVPSERVPNGADQADTSSLLTIHPEPTVVATWAKAGDQEAAVGGSAGAPGRGAASSEEAGDT